jgi:hypothetical protein
LCSTPGTPPEEREGRERTIMTSIETSRIGGRMCKSMKESAKIWKDLVEDPEMKVVEEKLRDAQEKAQKDSESINTLPPAESMTTILAQRKSYMEVENMWINRRSSNNA